MALRMQLWHLSILVFLIMATSCIAGGLDSKPKVALNLDIIDKNGNMVPSGATVTMKDGSGEEVQVNWDSSGRATAFGASGDWTVAVSVPGYSTYYYGVICSFSSNDMKVYLMENGEEAVSPPITAPKIIPEEKWTPLLLPPIVDVLSVNGPDLSNIGPLIGSQSPAIEDLPCI